MILLMTVTIEVSNEAGGMATSRRTFLLSENYATAEELEAAAVEFIRSSRSANEEALLNYGAAAGSAAGDKDGGRY
jgi:hypothetical protein